MRTPVHRARLGATALAPAVTLALSASLVWLATLACERSLSAAQPQPTRHAVRGMVIEVQPSRRTFVVSHDSVPGLMEAMTMPFDVLASSDLDGVSPGMMVEFTLVVGPDASHAEGVRVRPYESLEQDPLTARRLALVKKVAGAARSMPSEIAIGQRVPDFTLTDHTRRPIALSQLRGKVVAINFIYTSCALPQFCFRMANHFGVIQKRFKERLGRDLVLLTITFDPVRDQPETLAEYARRWQPDPEAWRFLTGAVPDVARVCGFFGVDVFQDEGLMNHSVHTAIVDRQGTLVANIEGNQFTAAQFGDLLETALRP